MTDESVREYLRKVKSVIFDVDGVLTDDTVYVGPDGAEFKRFHISDGLAIALMQKRLDIRVGIVSGRYSEATSTRAAELAIEPVVQGEHDKRAGVKRILMSHKVKGGEAAFVGNEILDLGGFAEVGLKIAVADSARHVLERADLVLHRPGGHGAARELFELICEARGVDFGQWFE